MCKVSIIVPIYNVEKYLEKCILSLINQTLKEIEIILINDGSTDNSLNIANKLTTTDSRIKLINKENGGLSLARNTGLKLAKGEYVAFIDSDDWVNVEMMERLYEKAKQYNCDLVSCNYLLSGQNNENLYRYPISSDKIIEKEDLYTEIYSKIISGDIKTPVWDKIYKREFLFKNNIMFDDKIIRFEDWHFYVKVCENATRIYHIDEGLYHYRIVNNSLSKKYYDNFFDMILNLHERKLKFMNNMNLLDENNKTKAEYNFIDDMIKAISHILYDNKDLSTIYQVKKVKNILKNQTNNKFLNKKSFTYYLNNTKINCYYANIILNLIKYKQAFLLVLTMKLFKLLRG